MGGNVGKSFAEMVAEDLEHNNLEPERHFVLEVSSFQLDDIQAFRPGVSLLLNITPDHLDRYEYKLENYIKSKFRIAMNQRGTDLMITNANDVNIQNYLSATPDSVKCKKYEVRSADLMNGYVRVADYSFDLSSSALKGPHNMFNAACAIRAALEVGVGPEAIEEAIYSFTPPPHRLERVAEVNGVLFINDSKATNVDSVFYALQAMDKPTIWIVGGTDKGNDYAPLFPFVEKNVKAIVCMGIDNVKLFKTFGPFNLPMVEAKSADEAVRLANDFSQAGDVVLLSPACASFDLFKNYEDRGDQFKKSVLSLKSK
jgi:UDP-N-acetylmuramoylalanine--D-glutamate ligase